MSDVGKWSVPYVPKSANVLKAIAMVTLRHNQLDDMLKYTIKSVAGVTIEQALDANRYKGSKVLRERLNKLARQRLGEGAALIKFESLLERCARASQKRNELVHRVWSRTADGGRPRVTTEDHKYTRPPTASQLNSLAHELYTLMGELNHARLVGFLAEALKKKKLV